VDSTDILSAMPSHIALLRGVNVGGNRMIGMADLRAMLADIGLKNGATLLQSGNMVFDGGRRSSASLEKLLETEAKKRLGLATDFFVYDADSWRRVIAENPLRKEAERSPAQLVVMFLRDAPDAAKVRTLHDGVPGNEIFRVAGRQLYTFFPDGMGRSKFGGALVERRLGTRGTGRNWNTVLKLAKATS
jgi:uncharacterized protein (DUF1697 family)